MHIKTKKLYLIIALLMIGAVGIFLVVNSSTLDSPQVQSQQTGADREIEVPYRKKPKQIKWIGHPMAGGPVFKSVVITKDATGDYLVRVNLHSASAWCSVSLNRSDENIASFKNEALTYKFKVKGNHIKAGEEAELHIQLASCLNGYPSGITVLLRSDSYNFQSTGDYENLAEKSLRRFNGDGLDKPAWEFPAQANKMFCQLATRSSGIFLFTPRTYMEKPPTLRLTSLEGSVLIEKTMLPAGGCDYALSIGSEVFQKGKHSLIATVFSGMGERIYTYTVSVIDHDFGDPTSNIDYRLLQAEIDNPSQAKTKLDELRLNPVR